MLNFTLWWCFQEVSSLPEGASVPALGLSNKAVYDGSQSSVQDDRLIQTPSNQQYAETCFSPLHLTGTCSVGTLSAYVPTDSLSNCWGEGGMVGVYAIPVNQFLLIQYYDYVFIIFEVLMYTFLLILQSAGCSPLLVRYGAIEMTALIITVIIILFCSCSYCYRY